MPNYSKTFLSSRCPPQLLSSSFGFQKSRPISDASREFEGGKTLCSYNHERGMDQDERATISFHMVFISFKNHSHDETYLVAQKELRLCRIHFQYTNPINQI